MWRRYQQACKHITGNNHSITQLNTPEMKLDKMTQMFNKLLTKNTSQTAQSYSKIRYKKGSRKMLIQVLYHIKV